MTKSNNSKDVSSFLQSAPDANGSVWGYDPIADKWSVKWGEQSSTSQNLDTLKQKVEKWKSAAVAKEKATGVPSMAKSTQTHFGIASLFGEGNSQLDLMSALSRPLIDQGKDKIHGYSVKTSVDETGRLGVDRYQASHAGASWESARSKHLFLMRFEALDEEEQAWWGGFLRTRAKMALAQAARRAIYNAWSAKKEDETRFVCVTHAGEVKEATRAQTSSSHAKTWALSRDWPLLSAKEFVEDLPAWEKFGDKWVLQDVSIALEPGSHGPTFQVSHIELGHVFESREFKEAFTMARATVETMKAVAPSIKWKLGDWALSPKDYTGNGIDWKPGQAQVRGVVALLGKEASFSSTEKPKLMALQQIEERGYGRKKGWEWSVFSAENTYTNEGSKRRYSSMAQEDHSLDLMANVSELLRPTLQELEANGSVSERLRRQSEQSLRGARDEMLDGEPLASDPKIAIEHWHRLLGAMEMRANAHPEVKAFGLQCEDLVNQAKQLLQDAPDAQWVAQASGPAESKPRSMRP